MRTPQRVEHLVAANVSETLWLRFRRLTSPTLCRRIIEDRSPTLDAPTLERKADGVASAVRSAIGYWQTGAPTLNARILTRYYALLQVSIAEQVASSNPFADLDSVQRHTERGHGFAALQSKDASFPHNYYVACMRSGHFASYATSRGIDLSASAFEKRPRDWDDVPAQEQTKLVSLADLLLRIPELRTIAMECLGRPALSFQVGFSERNQDIMRGKRPARPGETKTTYVLLLCDATAIQADWLNSLDLPFTNFQLEKDAVTESSHFVGEFTHPADDSWWEYFEHYKSDYCGTSVVAPFWGTEDTFLLHLATMYALSIVVRYLPSLWHQVEHGSLDHIRALIEHYLTVLDNVGPGLAVERVTGVRVQVDTPGSFGAPI